MDFIMNAKTFTLGDKKLHVLFLTTVGSQLHNLNLAGSDVDLKGVFVWDLEASFGLDSLPDTVELKTCDSDEWADLVSQFNSAFNLDLDVDEDLVLFESKKFFLTAMKNDFNLFDMLFADKKHHVFNTDAFQKVLDSKSLFLNSEKANLRFGGMAHSSLNKNAKKLNSNPNRDEKQERNLHKNLAKSLQFMFALDSLLRTKTYSPVLPEEQRLEVLEVKKGNSNFEKVSERYAELKDAFDVNFENMEQFDNQNRTTLNQLLVDLNKASL